MASEYAPLTPAVLRQAAEFVLRDGGGMCVAVCRVLWRLGHSNEGKSFRLLYEASEGKLWRVMSGYGYLRRFGLPGAPNASGERAACLRRMANWLEAREIGHGESA